MSNKAKINLIIGLVVAVVVAWNFVLKPKPEITNWPRDIQTIVAYGDSITRGYGAPRDKDYPKQLSEKIGIQIINKGVDGDETTDGLNRLDRDLLSLNPDMVLLCLGGNDMLSRKEPDLVKKNLALMIKRIQEQNAVVVLIEVRHVVPLLGYGDLYRDIAHERGCIFVPDVLGGIVTNKRMMKDQIHPNKVGYKKMSDKIHKYIKKYLN